MEQIHIYEYRKYEPEKVLALYKSVGWSVYYKQPELLKQAFSGSLCVIGAFVGPQLVGLIRVVGDGITVVFIQDVLVQPAYQRQGIGTQLIAAVLARYKHVRQLHLMTDDTPATVAFYKAVGFTGVETLHWKAFTKLRI